MRTIHLTLNVSDEEFSNFLARLATQSTVTNDEGAESEGAADTAADPSTLDKNGVPWLESVHASTKGQTKEGFWRGGKGVTKEERTAAENAWKAANTPPPAMTSPAPTFTPPPSAFNGATAMPGFPPAAAPVMPSLPVTPIEQPVTYEQIAALYQELVGKGRVNESNIGKVYHDAGVTDPNALLTDETLRRRLFAELNKYSG